MINYRTFLSFVGLCTLSLAFVCCGGGDDSDEPGPLPSTGKSQVVEAIKNCEVIRSVSDKFSEDILADGVTYTKLSATKANGKPAVIYVVNVAPHARNIAVMTEIWEKPAPGEGFVDNSPSNVFRKHDAKGHRILAMVNGDFFQKIDNKERGKGPMIYRGEMLQDRFYHTWNLAHQGLSFIGIDKQGKMQIGTRDQWDARKNDFTELTGAGSYFLRNGRCTDGDDCVMENGEVLGLEDHYPTNCIGYGADGRMVFLIVDGRTSTSDGLYYNEMSRIMKALGCTDACMMDGGGSAQLLVRYDGNHARLMNKPTDGRERKVCNYWAIVDTSK